MQELQIFNYESKEVRTVEVNGEVFWVAKDVCEILELSDVSMSVSRLDDDEKGTSQIETPGGLQNMVIINESGLYNLIIRSDKPKAKPFKKWITSEVLPSIRKTGSYNTNVINTNALNSVIDRLDRIEKKINIKTLMEKSLDKDMIIIDESDNTIIVKWHGEKYIATNNYSVYWNVCHYHYYKGGNHPLIKQGLYSKYKALEWIKRNL